MERLQPQDTSLSEQRVGGLPVKRRGAGALSVHDGWSWCLEVLSLWIQNLPTSRENQRN